MLGSPSSRQRSTHRGRGQAKYPQSQWYPGRLPFTPIGKKAFDGIKFGNGPRHVPPASGNDPLSKPPIIDRRSIVMGPRGVLHDRRRSAGPRALAPHVAPFVGAVFATLVRGDAPHDDLNPLRFGCARP